MFDTNIFGNYNTQPVEIKIISDTATIPTKAHPDDACYDIYADTENEPVVIYPQSKAVIHTGFQTKIPRGYFAAIFPRSGLACKYNVRLANSVAVIDSNYRGEWYIVLYNDSDEERVIHHGDRIAQFCLVPVIDFKFYQADELDDTDRGEGGFGSSGI